MKIALTILMALTLTSAVAAASDTGFPNPGTPYTEARLALLKQGLQIAPNERHYSSAKRRAVLRMKGIVAPEPVPSPDNKFREIDCWKLDLERDPGVKCQVLFLETSKEGWKNYVVVPLDPQTLMIGDIHYPTTAEGLPSIPPPLAKDLPQIGGTYFAARKLLQAQGYRPARNHDTGWLARVCATPHCKRYTTLPEAGCSGTGAAFCNAYWIAKDNRVLRVTTIGEYPLVYFANWSSWKELKEAFGG